MDRPDMYGTTVSGAAKNAAYDILRTLTVEQLQEARERSHVAFARNQPEGDLFRHQIDFTIERKLSGRW